MNPAVLLHKIEGRPELVVKSPPDRVVVVYCNWIIDHHGLRSLAHILDVSLELEFGRVYSDDNQSMVPVLPRPRSDIGEGAPPVNAGICPEVDEDDVSAKALAAQWWRIEPFCRTMKRRQITFNRQPESRGS